VLGASVYNFTAYLSVGMSGAEVTALQQFLMSAGYSIPDGATGYFGSETKAAVMAYQKENGLPSTGYVGPLTVAMLNKGVVPTTVEDTTNLTPSQVSSILSVLQSFGIDAATMAQVKAALGE
jgi:peptidoglycan hydrolase-like protein with peptidoglycan-binding domain